MGWAPFLVLMIGAVVVTLMILREEWKTSKRPVVFFFGVSTIVLMLIFVGFYFGLYLGLWWHWR